MIRIEAVAAARTEAVRQILAKPLSSSAISDYLFLETWERCGTDKPGEILRASQIRRANPALAAAIRAEIGGRNVSKSIKVSLD